MLLEDHIRYCIYNHPSLYRDQTYELSRLKVLDHLYFVIGTGYEWHKDGYLFKSSKKCRKTLPKNYFDLNLFVTTIDPTRWDEVKTMLGDRFFYKKTSRFLGTEVIFEAKDMQEADKLFTDFGWWHNAKANFSMIMNASATYQINPYPLCEYSGLVEILHGKTNSLHEENFNLIPQADWLAGCIDIAQYALYYYNDENLNGLNRTHPNQHVPQLNYELESADKNGEKPFWVKNLKKDETIEQYCQRIWDNYRRDQLQYLNKFLKKFGK